MIVRVNTLEEVRAVIKRAGLRGWEMDSLNEAVEYGYIDTVEDYMLKHSDLNGREAISFMGYSEDDCHSAIASYFNGKWTDHVDDMIKKLS